MHTVMFLTLTAEENDQGSIEIIFQVEEATVSTGLGQACRRQSVCQYHGS